MSDGKPLSEESESYVLVHGKHFLIRGSAEAMWAVRDLAAQLDAARAAAREALKEANTLCHIPGDWQFRSLFELLHSIADGKETGRGE